MGKENKKTKIKKVKYLVMKILTLLSPYSKTSFPDSFINNNLCSKLFLVTESWTLGDKKD